MFEGAGQGSCLVPKVTCLLLPIPGHRLPIGGASTITESLPSGQEKDPQNQEKRCIATRFGLYFTWRNEPLTSLSPRYSSSLGYVIRRFHTQVR
jgi:hypothetical protein